MIDLTNLKPFAIGGRRECYVHPHQPDRCLKVIREEFAPSKLMNFFSENWCLSFKHSLIPRWPLNFFQAPRLPEDAKIVAFTGKPDIDDEATRGEWPVNSVWRRLYMHVRPTPWIAENWR